MSPLWSGLIGLIFTPNNLISVLKHNCSSETHWFLALGLRTTKALASPKSANFKRISLSIRRFWGLNFDGLTREIRMLQNRWVFSPEGFRAQRIPDLMSLWMMRLASEVLTFLDRFRSLKNWVMFVLSPKLPGNSGASHFFCEYVSRYMDIYIYCVYIYIYYIYKYNIHVLISEYDRVLSCRLSLNISHRWRTNLCCQVAWHTSSPFTSCQHRLLISFLGPSESIMAGCWIPARLDALSVAQISLGLPCGDKWPRTEIFMYLGTMMTKCQVNSDSGDTSNESKIMEPLFHLCFAQLATFSSHFPSARKPARAYVVNKKPQKQTAGRVKLNANTQQLGEEASENWFLPRLKQLHHEFTI